MKIEKVPCLLVTKEGRQIQIDILGSMKHLFSYHDKGKTPRFLRGKTFQLVKREEGIILYDEVGGEESDGGTSKKGRDI